jgi:hypothetical protein
MLKRLRLILLTLTLGFALAAGYVAVPFWTTWTIREAIKASDSAYLETKIEWASVRSTLKESLTAMAVNAPSEGTADQPSIWQRVKTYVSKGAVDKFVEATVTPTGMAGLFSLRKSYQANLSGEPQVRRPVWERMRSVWSRVTRAEFKGLRRFEMDMIDKEAPDRTIKCVLELRGLEWKMTELRVAPSLAKPPRA